MRTFIRQFSLLILAAGMSACGNGGGPPVKSVSPVAADDAEKRLTEPLRLSVELGTEGGIGTIQELLSLSQFVRVPEVLDLVSGDIEQVESVRLFFDSITCGYQPLDGQLRWVECIDETGASAFLSPGNLAPVHRRVILWVDASAEVRVRALLSLKKFVRIPLGHRP